MDLQSRQVVSGVIFDMDGLMVDTEPLYQESWQRAARELGHEIDDVLYATFVGRPTAACEDILLETFGPLFPLRAFQARWPRLWRDEVERVGVTLKPGLPEILEVVRSHRLPAAVATSSESVLADLTLNRAGLRHWFSVVVTGDRVTHGKPAPDIYLEAAKQLGVPAAECVAFEDSEAGIIAVQAAGMRGVLVPHWPASSAARRAATRVATTLHQAREVLVSMIDEGKPSAMDGMQF